MSDLRIVAMMGLIGGPAAAIDALEDGERRKLGWGQLPHPQDEETRAALAAAGVEWGERIDQMYCQAKVPEGWKTERTDHHLYTNLLDANGRVRAMMLIHAWDRDAWLSGRTRLTATHHVDQSYERDPAAVPAIKTSNGVILWRGTPIAAVKGGYTKEGARIPNHYDLAQKRAAEILSQFWPEWQNIQAYWDVSDEEIRMCLPENESEGPIGETYSLHAAYYRTLQDHYEADRGEACRGIFPTPEEAERVLRDLATGSSYGEKVRYTIHGPQGQVATWEWKSPAAERRENRRWGRGKYYFEDGYGFFEED